jgi:hypothetical protein
LGARFVPWVAVDSVVTRRLRGTQGLQVFVEMASGRRLHLRAVSGGMLLSRRRAPAFLAGVLSNELARARWRQLLASRRKNSALCPSPIQDTKEV